MTIARRLARLEATETPPETVPRDYKAELLAKLQGFEPSYPVPVYPPEVVAEANRRTIADLQARIDELDQDIAAVDSGVWPAWINTPSARRKHRESLATKQSLNTVILKLFVADRDRVKPDQTE